MLNDNLEPTNGGKVVDANANFGVIGLELDYDNPVPGFASLRERHRYEIQMSDMIQ